RAPLALAGPGIRAGRYTSGPRHVDIAPTICHGMGFPLIDGRDWSGRRSSERQAEPDVYLERQDGAVLNEIFDRNGPAPPKRVYLVLFDGLTTTERHEPLARNDASIVNLRRILARAALFAYGSTVNFPSITWPSHSTILTGAWCGHHDIVNPTYYARE